ncbi:MAG: hypothetical protein Q4C05_07480 [Akkermansia sp.]|nr:hypothetical protein [Akkermansia sp.]
MTDNAKAIKIIFIILTIILLSTSVGFLSSDENPLFSLALCIIPISILSIIFIKEKIWYTWFLLPPLFLPLGIHSDYKYFLIILTTLPFYIWFIIREKIPITWNKLLLLDIPLSILLIYIAYVFLSNPFGIGVDYFEDYYGGKGYVLCLGALLAYISYSTLVTNSHQLGKLLTWYLPILIFFTIISTIKALVLGEGESLENVNQTSGNEGYREMEYLSLSILIGQLIIIKYNIKDIIIKIWPSILGGLSCLGILISGFRSRVLFLAFTFICVSILYKRWFTLFIIPLIGISCLTILSANGTTRELPSGIQRCLAPLEFIDIDPNIRREAQGSIDWRTQMWDWALDDRELFIKDKIWGDGFSFDIYTMKANIYFQTRNIREVGDSMGNMQYARTGQWHNGPISTIHSLGYVGLAIFSILSVIGMYYSWLVSTIYKKHQYKTGILYISLTTFMSTPIFYFIYADAFKAIPLHIINLTIIKLLYCCAKREGLYITKSTRKEYIPLSCRTAQAE